MTAMTDLCARCQCRFGEHEGDTSRCPVGGGTFEQRDGKDEQIRFLALAILNLHWAIDCAGKDEGFARQGYLATAMENVRRAAPAIFGED